MATVEQATMPYALDALRNASLRKLAQPELTRRRSTTRSPARPRSRRCSTRSRRPPTRARPPTTSSRPSRRTITPTGLSDATSRRCSAPSSSRRRSTPSTASSAARTRRPPSRPPERSPRRTGSGSAPGSLTSYIRDPKKWGENRAAWQRKAVQAMPGDVGARINTVSTSSGGTALAGPVIRARVDAELAKKPKPTEEQLVTTVGARTTRTRPATAPTSGRHTGACIPRRAPSPSRAC